MIILLLHLLRLLPFLCGGHRQLALENLALRQQLAVYKRTANRPKLQRSDRLLWVWLSRVWPAWRQALVIVTPATVLRWQRRRFRRHWATLSGRRPAGHPPVDAAIKALVRRMAAANPLWGAPRIHGELLKLGIDVAERTVSRLLPKRPSPPSQTWRTFLTNHVRDLVSIDFFTVPTARLRVLFYYRQGAAEAGRTVTRDNLGFLICAVTADTKAKALEAGRHFVWRMGPTLRAPIDWFSPVGMRSRAGKRFALKARPRSLASMSYEELCADNFIIAGAPDEVADRFALVHRELGIGHLLLEAQESRMDHPTTMRSIELMGAKVIPAVARL